MVESRRGPHEREPSASKRSAPTSATPDTETMDELVVTLNPATREVVKVERLSRGGQRKELSEQESAELVGGDELDDVREAVQEAYEAGVAQGLDQDDDDEVDDDLVILQLLLDRPRRADPLGRGVRRAVLHRLLLRRLLRRALPHTATASQQRRRPIAEGAEGARNGSGSHSHN